MAVHDKGILTSNLNESVKSSKILVVGAGGIGCELLKNLVLSGFENLEVIDLDTIDVSNLNRQFLFHKQHVGRSKAEVARDSAHKFNPSAKIKCYHDSVLSPTYGVSFYKNFNLIMNALDNRTARNHVNRMCLAADIPLIESGTAGYLGQVTVIKKSRTECYECQPKATQKTFPGCTIRNTPSEPIHCIVWAKHLFNQLFGEADADEDVSPDSADPEQVGQAGDSALSDSANANSTKVSTRAWAVSHNYDPQKLFNKLFVEDIQYLLSMDKLWTSRRPPQPMKWSDESNDDMTEDYSNLIQDQRPWSASQCCSIFQSSVNNLSACLSKLKDGDHLVWDKDDKDALDFVTACANIRARIFGIPEKTRFDIKSMAGNIIPAIATTNAIIAGLIVLQAFKILSEEFKDCRTVYLNRKPNPKKRLLVPCHLDTPNSKCYVCSEKPEVTVIVNSCKSISIKTLEEKILKNSLNMVAPDVEIDGEGTIIISSEPGEIDFSPELPLSKFNIQDGTRLNCDDFLQNYNLRITISVSKLEDGVEFLVVGDPEKLKAEQEEKKRKELLKEQAETPGKQNAVETIQDDEELICLDDIESRKRKAEDTSNGEPSSKKPKLGDDDLLII